MEQVFNIVFFLHAINLYFVLLILFLFFFFFFFQAEDGIRDVAVTGVQTCALPIYELRHDRRLLRRARETRLAAAPDRLGAGLGVRSVLPEPGIAPLPPVQE